jgi:hypothetical protein
MTLYLGNIGKIIHSKGRFARTQLDVIKTPYFPYDDSIGEDVITLTIDCIELIDKGKVWDGNQPSAICT